jgi:hypothetical protein
MRSRHRWLLGLAAIAAAGGGGGAAAQQQQGGGCCACSGNNGSGTRGGTAMTEFRLGALFPMFRRAAGAANGMLDVGGAQVRCLAHVCRLLLPLPPPPPLAAAAASAAAASWNTREHALCRGDYCAHSARVARSASTAS